MLDGLRTEIAELQLRDGDDILAAFVERDRLDAKIVSALVDFDRARLWDLDARVSLADWLRVRGRMTSHEARRMARMAERTADLPCVAASWESGEMSTSAVHIVTRRLTARRRPAFAAMEPELVPGLVALDTSELETVMQQFVDAFDAANPPRLPDEPEDTLYFSRTFHDRGELRSSLGPDSSAVVEAALTLAESRDAEGEPRTPAERKAAALVDLCEFFLKNRAGTGQRRHAPHVHLVCTPEQLAFGRAGRTLDGDLLSGPGIATLACDSVITRIVDAGGEIIDLGRSVRAVPQKLFGAVAARDKQCRFPGCDRPAKWCDAHHVIPWWAGGRTDIGSLVLLCRRHHRRIHTPGWAAKLLIDGTFEVTTPTGRVLVSCVAGADPPRPEPPG